MKLLCDICGVVGSLLLCVCIGGIIEGECATTRWQNAAVRNGHAEYYLDITHERQWRWLPSPVPTTEKRP